MTRKDFQLIADVFNDYKGDWMTKDDETLHENLVLRMAKALAPTNANFDHERFVHACEADNAN